MKNKLILTFLTLMFSSCLLAQDFYFEVKGTIENNKYYRDMIEYITFKVHKDDTVYLYINSRGGSINTGFKLINALKMSGAKVYGRVEGRASSMAALIAVSCDKLRLSSSSYIMFHKSYLDFGFYHYQLDDPVLHRYVQTYVFPYLTDGEIKRYCKGEDIFIKGYIFQARWKHKDPYHPKVPLVSNDELYDVEELLR